MRPLTLKRRPRKIPFAENVIVGSVIQIEFRRSGWTSPAIFNADPDDCEEAGHEEEREVLSVMIDGEEIDMPVLVAKLIEATRHWDKNGQPHSRSAEQRVVDVLNQELFQTMVDEWTPAGD